ncbi:LacI family DNA-binding transcriptional regulator [uncultured Pseudokineococcus sp.]|uniref:LacI family DNA-binding transcriptional regulator n=1 Tax=uncultured Pseudokineococcus sp. TaxID=1642928 RepID=UPI002638A9E1|nr:LacI family DNA-binding transcriptional regulator [uncultured Pseudokineococcus sp.]
MSAEAGRTTATLDAVARTAGVSRATASRALTGSPRVSDDARERVLAAAASLSYVPNAAARALVTRRSDAVAFVVCEQEERFFSDPFFASVLKGAHRVVAASRRQLVFAVVASEDDRARLVRFAAGGHVDAAIFLSVHAGETAPERLRERGVPVVLVGRPPAGVAEDVPRADTDNVAGARAAAEHVLGRGRRRLGVITGPLDMPSAEDRLEGVRRAVAAAGGVVGAPGGPAPAGEPSVAVVEGDYTTEGGRRAAAALLERVPGLDAVLAQNDLMAVGALGLLRERGIGVPDDVAVVGYDDIPLASAVGPALTTVHQPLEELGRESATLAVALAVGGAEEGRGGSVLRPRLVVRSSS